MKKMIIQLIILLLLSSPTLAADTCEIAWQVAKQAAETSAQDKAAGLKLFIKAQSFCPEDAGLKYNLGMAYANYGRPNDALPLLEQAVKSKEATAVWRNNLAAVLLQTGSDAPRALELAREAARQESGKAEVQLTLIDALVANGKNFDALQLAAEQTAKFSSNKSLNDLHAQLLDKYLATALMQIQQGQIEPGLSALQKADFSPDAAVVRAEVLLRLQRFDEALKAASAGKQRFAQKADEFSQVEDGVFADLVRGYYEQFQQGDGLPAYAAAKELAEKYPQNMVVQKAATDLWNALLADAKSIEVPKPQQKLKSQRNGSGGRSADLLAGIGQLNKATVEAVDLSVDIDSQIPQGKQQRTFAIAVVIGNQNYARQNRGIGDVSYAGRDAEFMKRYLIQVMGFVEKNIIFRTDTTSGDLRNIFGTRENPKGRLHNSILPGESEVFVYYTGHGAPGPDGKSAYLVPIDAEADYIANNGYPLDLFYSSLSSLHAKSLTVVLDACFSGDSPSGALFKNISPAMVKNVRALQEVANGVVFSSADKDQVATWYPEKRHSLFTYFFLKGLGGAADSDKNKSVTAGELNTYLAKYVPFTAQSESNRKQTPLMVGNEAMVLAQFK